MRFYIPKRIKARWVEHYKLLQKDRYRYRIDAGLIKAEVSAEEFKQCWEYLHPVLTDDELFSLFTDSGFSPRDPETRSTFVRNVLQQYKVFYGFTSCVFVFSQPQSNFTCTYLGCTINGPTENANSNAHSSKMG